LQGGANCDPNKFALFCGTVFRIDPTSNAATVLHNFIPFEQEGLLPRGTLAVDAAGVLFGTTLFGGSAVSGGTVFALTP
jgi:hypothetical protein